jgi:glycosyltransferase involved in cell wall biosynthesis
MTAPRAASGEQPRREADAPTQLWVIVPAFDEEARIGGTLAALAAQTDRDFRLIVVDNGSRDRTHEIALGFAATASVPTEVLIEPEKGVGSAVDTGFRYAIAHGATLLARTDADCLPDAGWVAAARAALDAGAGMVCGRITARADEHGPLGRAGFRVLTAVAAAFGRIRPANRASGAYLAPYRMHAGNNMAIRADLYLRVGGMPRRPSPTDRTFLNRVRRHTADIVHCGDMVVGNSTRRLRAYGIIGTARWYLDLGSGGLSPDPR